jgi:uncharacterized protein (DUF1015 family)
MAASSLLGVGEGAGGYHAIFARTVDIDAFAALRYADSLATELDRCISLPYDQFGDEGRDERYRRHPRNVVRLIKPRPEAGLAAHESARRTLLDWQREGVLRRDPRAALYPYRQRTEVGGERLERWAVICRLRLSAFDHGPVKPHERTYPDTVGERSRLREVVGADLGLILVAYDDPVGRADTMVREAAGEPGLLEATDEAGTANALWRWDDAARVEALRGALRDTGAFIADGHHRYTAALGHWQGRGADPEDPAGWVMAALVSAASPGLRIFPTHRLVESAPGPAARASWEAAGLRLTSLGRATSAGAAAEAAARALAEAGGDHAIVVLQRDDGGLRADLARAPRGSLVAAPWPSGVPASWRQLDIPVLHSLMLEPWLGEALSGQTEDHGAVDYCNDHLQAAERVAGGQWGAAFLVAPLTVAEVQRTVAAGDVLPAKSTNFLPKVVAGLTIHSLDGTDAAGR